ncbi:MAG: hypothetical protein Q7V19_08100 [Bacteroidales bacterium]|nr:hypothetical protein [Bacteroidales bacterium]MDP2196830.1 hypothetical protein [Rhodocyclaceae bacterium]
MTALVLHAQPLATSIPGAVLLTSLSETVIHAAINAGTLKTRQHGKRTVILVRDLERWLDSFPVGRAAAPAHLEGSRKRGRPRKQEAA